MQRLRLICSMVSVWAVLAAAPAARADDLATLTQLAAGGQAARAMEGVERLLATRPNDAALRFFKGVLLTDAGQSADAMAWFERLTQDYPELPEPYNNLAVLYAGLGDYERARVALGSALRANPRYAVAQANLGDVHVQLAQQAYQRAFGINPSDASVPAKLAALRELSASAARTKSP